MSNTKMPEANTKNSINNLTWWLILIATLTGILASTICVRHGGYLAGETDMYLVDHLSDRPFLSRIICPHINDATQYQARELSHFFEDIDAHLCYWCYLAGFPHFYSILTFSFFIFISCLHWQLGQIRLGLDKLTLLLLLLVFWTNPNFYLMGTLFRMAKQGAALFVYLNLFLLLWRMLKVDESGRLRFVVPEFSKIDGACFFLASLGACFSDRQGFALVVLLGVITMVWAILMRSRKLAICSCSWLGAAGIHTFYNMWLGPAVVHKFSGFTVSFEYQKLDMAEFKSNFWMHFKQAAIVVSDTTAFVLGDISSWFFIGFMSSLLISIFFLKPHIETQRLAKKLKHPGIFIGITALAGVLGILIMYTIMIDRHAPMIWENLKRGAYYALPLNVILLAAFTLLLKLFWDRYAFQQKIVWVVLGIVVVFNVESLPEHFRIFKEGHEEGNIEASPFCIAEMKKISALKQTAVISSKYDAAKSSELCQPENMIRNPNSDINLNGAVNGELFVNTSRYINFLKSKKGLDFYEPWARQSTQPPIN
jgi:hypothetical protein